MHRIAIAAAVLATLAAPELVVGSEEKHLVWSEIQITCPERKDTGKVVFKAKLKGESFTAVTIEALGKSHSVPKDLLARLDSFPLSSLTTTHEAGYERLGGHTVHFKLKRIETASGRPIESKVTLSVSKGLGISLTGPVEKTLGPAN
jgi:hypothetical protein